MDDVQPIEIEELVDVGHRIIRRPTLHLRWRDGVLQQAWEILREDAYGKLFGVCHEWRPVPKVDQ